MQFSYSFQHLQTTEGECEEALRVWDVQRLPFLFKYIFLQIEFQIEINMLVWLQLIFCYYSLPAVENSVALD